MPKKEGRGNDYMLVSLTDGMCIRCNSIKELCDHLNKKEGGGYRPMSDEEITRIQGVVSEYAKAEEEYINAALNPKYNKSSILTEELGYKTTDNVEEAKKNPTKLMLVQRETDGTITPVETLRRDMTHLVEVSHLTTSQELLFQILQQSQRSRSITPRLSLRNWFNTVLKLLTHS
jgi:hypothetical protein